MIFQIDKDILLQGIGRTQGVVARNPRMPVLAHCLLEAKAGGQLTIAATDLEVSFCGDYPAQILEAGGLTVPAVNFFNIIKELPSGPLNLEGTENANLIINIGEARYQLLGLPADQFPPLPSMTGHELISMESQTIKEMLEKTIFSVSLDELQPHLGGVYFEKISGDGKIELRLVSSDGHRLSLVDRTIPGSENFGFEEGILVPRKGVAEMLRLLGEEGNCALGIDQNNLILQQDKKILSIRLLEKKFPDYRRIIPAYFRLRVAVPRRELYEVLKRISLLSLEKFKGVILKFSPDVLELKYMNPEVGEGRERLAVKLQHLILEGDSGEAGVAEAEDPEANLDMPFEIGYNARYLMEPLNAIKSDEVYLEIFKKNKPCRIVGADDPHYYSIIMPMDLEK